jgi:23S rRNA-/tRNA-specific pseudouridylate synthase
MRCSITVRGVCRALAGWRVRASCTASTRTSGLLVVAKSDAAHEGLARQFADHSIERAYLAITHGVPMPTQGTLKGMIGRHHTDRKRMAILSRR